MTYVSINDKQYELPLAELYIERFNRYVHGNVLSFDGLDEDVKYKVVDELFGFICKTFVVTLGEMADSNPECACEKEIQAIRSRMDSVDRLQKFFHEQGKTGKSIEMMSKFMEEMFKIWDLVNSKEETIHRQVS